MKRGEVLNLWVYSNPCPMLFPVVPRNETSPAVIIRKSKAPVLDEIRRRGSSPKVHVPEEVPAVASK